jgi:hypothetical protein
MVRLAALDTPYGSRHWTYKSDIQKETPHAIHHPRTVLQYGHRLRIR